MTSEQVYQAVQNGEMTLGQFQDWADAQREEARLDGYESGYYSASSDSLYHLYK